MSPERNVADMFGKTEYFHSRKTTTVGHSHTSKGWKNMYSNYIPAEGEKWQMITDRWEPASSIWITLTQLSSFLLQLPPKMLLEVHSHFSKCLRELTWLICQTEDSFWYLVNAVSYLFWLHVNNLGKSLFDFHTDQLFGTSTAYKVPKSTAWYGISKTLNALLWK